MTLGEVLQDPSKYEDCVALFMSRDEKWGLNTRCVLPELDPYDEETYKQVIEGMTYVLGITDVQDIVWNAKAQIPNATQQQLLDAFLYYFDHDAFIDFAKVG